ncbi:MAG: Crp/Fnr family transcriptional regulator [Bacteroidia bacterium]|nr:Crp/Fnr family transcriptional regulator [Bacteroidia bacterium]
MKKSNLSPFSLSFKDVESFFNLDKIKQLYGIHKNLTWEDIKILVKIAKFRRYRNKSYVIEAGEKNTNVFFIFKGLVRSYKVNEKGDEITVSLYRENQFFLSAECHLYQNKSSFYFECLEPTFACFADVTKIQEILSRDKKVDETREFVSLKIFQQNYERINSFVLLTPEERYLDFVEKNPDLNQRVPNKYIANVLGVTPVSLSRIRKRLAMKKE